MVDDIINLIGRELVQYRHRHSPVSQRGKEGNGPIGTIAAADGNLVTTLYPTVLENNMQLFYLAGYVFILQRYPFIVSQSIEIPIINNASLDVRIETWY